MPLVAPVTRAIGWAFIGSGLLGRVVVLRIAPQASPQEDVRSCVRMQA
jgi:hypothetical protein